MQLDELDLRLLRVLQRDGRISNAELSVRAGVSASSCHRRVARLEAGGVIGGYAALLDRATFGRTTTAFVEITLRAQSEDVFDAFEMAVLDIPEVLECHLMAGSADYLLKVAVRDTEDFAQLHRRHLARLPGVAQMQSSFSLRCVRESTELPI